MTGKETDGNARMSLVERLFGAFAMQLGDIEARIAKNTGEGIVEDARVLSGLAKTLETLVSVERKVIETGDSHAPLDLEAIRTELAERLTALRLNFGAEDEAAAGDAA